MKCIKATKTTKQFKTGDIKRVSDREADTATRDGYWMYISKSEWKEATRKPVESEPEMNESVTISEKQLNKKKRSK